MAKLSAELSLELVRATASGDQVAFSELYRLTSGKLYAIASRMLGNADAAARRCRKPTFAFGPSGPCNTSRSGLVGCARPYRGGDANSFTLEIGRRLLDIVPGTRLKMSHVDPVTGERTGLMQMAPGSVFPEHDHREARSVSY
jgi:hypothetical protein